MLFFEEYDYPLLVSFVVNPALPFLVSTRQNIPLGGTHWMVPPNLYQMHSNVIDRKYL